MEKKNVATTRVYLRDDPVNALRRGEDD